MSTSLLTPAAVPRSFAARTPFYYGWVNLAVAVVASVATLPGRTWGLGLVTNQLLNDFRLDRIEYARLNLWATLIGATVAVPTGWLLDRVGARTLFSLVVFGLAGAVFGLSGSHTTDEFFLYVTLSRALGQTALSIVGVALVSKWFGRRTSAAMAVYMVGLLLGWIAAEMAVSTVAEEQGWRKAWDVIGWSLLVVAPVGWVLARSTPEWCGLAPDAPAEDAIETAEGALTLLRALATPVFWLFAAAFVLNTFTMTGISLFGYSLVVDRGLGGGAYKYMMAASTLGALLGSVLAWAAIRWVPSKRVVSLGLVLLLATLAYLPTVESRAELYADGFFWGMAIGLIGVASNTACREAFGRAHIGSIQGAIAIFHLLSSAFGPLVMAQCQARFGSYAPFFNAAAAGLALVALAIWFVPLPLESTPARDSQ
jgi:MFS family permease